MRLARLLLAAVIAVVVLVTGAAIALFTLDLGALGRPATRWAGDQLGRSLAIDGPVSIRAGRTLRFSAEGIRLGNAAWGSRADMLAVGRLTVEIDAASLLRRPVIVQRIQVEGLDLLLERRADGANNWDFGPETAAEPFTWPEKLPVVIERVSLPGARLRFIGPRLDRPLDLRFDSLEQRRVAGGMLELAGGGAANGEAIELAGRAGPFAGLVAGRDFSVNLAGRLGELELGLQLLLDDIARPVNTRLDLKLRGPGADYLTTRFGVRNLGAGPLELAAIVRPAADGTGVEGELTGEIGQFTIKARGALADPTVMGELRAELEVAGPDLSFAGGLAGVDRLPVEPFRLTAAFERAGEVFRIREALLTVPDGRATVSGTITRFTSLTGNDLRFRIEVADLARYRDLLGLPAALKGPFDVAGGIKASVPGGDPASRSVELLDVRASATLGQLTVSGPLGRRPDYYGTRLRFAATGPSLARVNELAVTRRRLPAVGFSATGEFEWTAAGAVIRQGELRAGQNLLAVDGLVARDLLGPGTDVTWRLAGPDAASLGGTLLLDGLPAGAFDLRGRLRRERQASRLDDVRGTLAGAEVRLAGRIADTPRLGTTLDLAVDGPRLETFASLVPDYKLPTGAFSVAGGLVLAPKRVELRGMRLAAAGAQGTVDADIELPLSAVRGDFRVVARGKDVTRFLPRIGNQRVAAVPFELRVRGQAQGGAWRLDEAEFRTAAGSISGSGKLDWAPDFSATALKVVVSTTDLAAAGRLFAVRLPAEPFDLQAEFTGTPAAFKAEQAKGRLGTTDFDGRLELQLGDRPVLDVAFRSDLLNLTPFLGTPDPAAAPEAAAVPGPARRRASPRLIPDKPIPLAWLNRLDGSLAVEARRTLFATFALDGLRMSARLKAGNLSLDSLEVQAPPDGRLTMSGAITQGPGGAAWRLAATGTRLRLARLGDTPAVRDARPRAELRLELAAAGATWRELARSLDGKLRLTSGPGAIPAGNLSALFGGLWRDLTAAVVPGVAVRDTVNVRCLAAFAEASAGVVRTTPALVMQTEKVNVITHGSVDLGTEQLEFYLSTAPRRGRVDVTVAEIVNPYMKITGSLASPGLGVDPKGVFFTGGAAVATAGISILAKGVWDRMFRAEDPCLVAAAEAGRLDGEAPAPKKRLFPRLRSGG